MNNIELRRLANRLMIKTMEGAMRDRPSLEIELALVRLRARESVLEREAALAASLARRPSRLQKSDFDPNANRGRA